MSVQILTCAGIWGMVQSYWTKVEKFEKSEFNPANRVVETAELVEEDNSSNA